MVLAASAFCCHYKKLQELICENGEKLRATMESEQKEMFVKYIGRMHKL